ncbi:Beta-alanine-activating enzyme [Phytophthora citrophthora]|uniref:Beta-alanine-activating enzyme n=1 Tax=Phytophthora citrophthora TaxID=4793 RepID=A0AAD9G0R9_9STRA|nr:Beta-alanine-activating enzyme [Phytophthora citrophthora]
MTIEEIVLALESLSTHEDRVVVSMELPSEVSVKRRKITHLVPSGSVNVIRGDANQDGLAFLSRYNQSSDMNGFHLPTCYTSPISSGSLGVENVWKVDLGKCIDASPLVVQHRAHEGRASSTWAIVGSHSAKLVCVDVQIGQEIWRVTLDDRIEACAALSVKHQLVYVGTYAGTFFALHLQTGEISWRFQAQGTIKSSALVLNTLGLVVVGAYDNKLYALDAATGQKQWAMDLQGSVFSTPFYCAWSKQLFAASTNGNVVAFSSSSDDAEFASIQEQWRLQLPAPVFAGLNADPLSHLLLVGCADGNLYGVKLESGEIQWQIPTEKPIFSSPCVHGTGSVVFGSHDGKLRKVDTCTGELQWATNLSGAVFASPTVVRLVAEPVNGGDGILICCVTTTSGQLCFCDEKTGVIIYQTGDASGRILDSIEANGDLGPLFGSPVLVDNWCLLGTRTNYFYGMKLTS